MYLSIPPPTLLPSLSLILHLLSLYPPLFLRYVLRLLPHSSLVIALSACHPKTTASFSDSAKKDWRRRQQLPWRQPQEKRNKNNPTVSACCLYSMSIHPCIVQTTENLNLHKAPFGNKINLYNLRCIPSSYWTSSSHNTFSLPLSLLLSFDLFLFISSLALSVDVSPSHLYVRCNG